jgi:hypothetical protein
VLVRVITLLLAVMMMTAAATQVWASPVVASAVDDVPDADLAVPALSEPIVVPEPERGEQASACMPPAPMPGRVHAAFVFRPPR